MKVKLTFNKQVFLTSAWNGSLEIHQINDDKKRVDTIPDLREYIADDYDIETFTGLSMQRIRTQTVIPRGLPITRE